MQFLARGRRGWLNGAMPPPPVFNAPYTLLLPEVQTAPVVLTSPHSGRFYPPGFLAASRLDSLQIRRSEDSFVEELFGDAPSCGMPLLAANFPRAYCDVNREPWELDPAMFADKLPDYVNTASARAQAGLGTLARVVGNAEPIYAGKLRFEEAEARVASCWGPFHDTLRGLIEATVARFGTCLLVDCHSMPSVAGQGTGQIVLGDAHGTSCAAAVTSWLERSFYRRGLRVGCNDPYAGGYITRQYGVPAREVQAVQVEVARDLYMHERQMTRRANFAATQKLMGDVLTELAKSAQSLLEKPPAALAAE